MYFAGACCRSLCNVSAVLVLVFRLHICLALDIAIFGIVLLKVCTQPSKVKWLLPNAM